MATETLGARRINADIRTRIPFLYSICGESLHQHVYLPLLITLGQISCTFVSH